MERTKQIPRSKSRLSPTFVDLFAGAGGFSLGFTRAGFRCLGVIENDPVACESYAANFPSHLDLPLSRLGPQKGNILKMDAKALRAAGKRLAPRKVDVLIAGPPCQGFSRVGRGKLDSLARRNGAFKSDPRNSLYLNFIEVLVGLRPKMFLFENVPGMLHFGGTNVAELICEDTTSAGYGVICTVLNAAWFGVPQTRERVFILGIRSDLRIRPTFPRPIYRADLNEGHLSAVDLSRGHFHNPLFFERIRNPEARPPAVTVEEALGDLRELFDHQDNSEYRSIRSLVRPQPYKAGRPTAYARLMRNWGPDMISTEITDHFCRYTPRDYEIFGRMLPGEKYQRAVEIAEEFYRREKRLHSRGMRANKPRRRDFVPPYNTSTFPDKWRKLIPDQPSWTITAHLAKDCYSHIHYDSPQKRTITIREAARLQSFPDAFVFKGNMGDCFAQIGNAVPPLLAFQLARHLRTLLARKSGSHKNAV